MDHREVAVRTLKALGGEDNIVGLAHCATRLRLVLKDSKRSIPRPSKPIRISKASLRPAACFRSSSAPET